MSRPEKEFPESTEKLIHGWGIDSTRSLVESDILGSKVQFCDDITESRSKNNEEYTASKRSIASRRSKASHISQPDVKKDARSILLSVFNMMNLVVGGGVIGLPYAASNFGYMGFIIAILTVVGIACLTQFFNLSAADELYRIDPLIIPGYEELGYLAAGQRKWGRWVVSSIVMFHTFTCCCAYSFVIKKEIGPILARLMNLIAGDNGEQIDLSELRGGNITDMGAPYWYLNEKFLVGVFIAFIIFPLACVRNVKYLGWTSMIAIVSILFFVGTVISQSDAAAAQCGELILPSDCMHCPTGIQNCTMLAFTYTPETIYSLPTLLFSFECHGTMLPIYCDLRRKNKSKMMKIIFSSLFLVVSLYIITALYGYKSFLNWTADEFLLMFEYLVFESKAVKVVIVIAKMMIVFVVTFSAPLFCFVFRKSVFLNMYPDDDPEDVSNKLHYGFTFITMAVVYLIVASVESLKIFFAMGGQISATNLMIVFPSVFYVFICHKNRKFSIKTLLPWILISFGVFNQTVGTVYIVWHAINPSSDHSLPSEVTTPISAH